MKLRIGRNNPCWCKAIYPDGKRKKYKDCHLERDEQPRVRMDEILGGLKSSFGKRYCLHASAGTDCSGDIIKAHTIQRNGGLSRIAHSGKVYTFDPGTSTLVKTGHLSARLIGVGLASTFTGFCGRHDDTAFEPVEKHPFIGTDEQILVLIYLPHTSKSPPAYISQSLGVCYLYLRLNGTTACHIRSRGWAFPRDNSNGLQLLTFLRTFLL